MTIDYSTMRSSFISAMNDMKDVYGDIQVEDKGKDGVVVRWNGVEIKLSNEELKEALNTILDKFKGKIKFKNVSGNGGAGNTENPVFKALFPKEYANYKDHNSIKSNAELKVEALLEKYPQLKDMNLDFSEIIKLIELIEKNPDLEVEIDLKNLGWDEFNYRESSGGGAILKVKLINFL